MNILVLHSELGVLQGGGENFTRNLFKAFANRGHSIAAAFVAGPAGNYPIPLPANIKPIPLRGRWSRNLGAAALSTIGMYIPHASRLRVTWDHFHEAISWRAIRWHNRRFRHRIEREFRSRWTDFDAVYVHGDTSLATLAAQHRPTILRLPGPVTAELEPQLRAIHAVCANGDALARIRSLLGNHATELPVGLDERIFKPGPTMVRARLHWTRQDRVIGYVGRLTHLKGVDLLAAAFRQISKHVPNARLLMIGKGGDEQNLVSEFASELERKRVHVEPKVEHEQLPEWYRAMDLFVMPSRYENYSNALLEAMACGIPFLASDVGGNRITAATGAGWLFEPGSVPSLTVAIRKILEDGSQLAARGALAANYARNCGSWNSSAERLESIISSRLGVKN